MADPTPKHSHHLYRRSIPLNEGHSWFQGTVEESRVGDNRRALQEVEDYTPPSEGQHIRVLLHGPVGAGKSSFINTVNSTLRRRMYTQALASNTATSCFTKEYTTYKIPKRGQQPDYPFVFNDIMGLDPTRGVLVDDVKLALKGHVKNGYKFNPESGLAQGDQFYNSCPTLNDKVHVLVCVVPADSISRMNDATVKKIKDIRMEASRLKIPQVAVITKIDEVCPEVKKDLKNVYRVKYLKEKMEEFSANVGIPMNCIFPVKNYNEEMDLDDDIDSLMLSSLKQIINYGEDGINFLQSQPES
ncbi:interferon-induced protein 44-like [Clinocottus analis]|uniref:interferon-induced protein 44-like n=1 Tax=Clinocottus analis TaxID=304258 RepID=UPI0035BEDCE2